MGHGGRRPGLGHQRGRIAPLTTTASASSIRVTEGGQVDILHLEDLFSGNAKIKYKGRTK